MRSPIAARVEHVRRQRGEPAREIDCRDRRRRARRSVECRAVVEQRDATRGAALSRRFDFGTPAVRTPCGERSGEQRFERPRAASRPGRDASAHALAARASAASFSMRARER